MWARAGGARGAEPGAAAGHGGDRDGRVLAHPGPPGMLDPLAAGPAVSRAGEQGAETQTRFFPFAV